MFDLQLKLLAAMTDLSTNYVDMLAGAANTETTSEPAADDDRAERRTSEASPEASRFPLPDLPKAGGSWYQAPFENPMLAYWDEMTRPWRTYSPSPMSLSAPFGGWPTVPGMQAPFATFGNHFQWPSASKGPDMSGATAAAEQCFAMFFGAWQAGADAMTGATAGAGTYASLQKAAKPADDPLENWQTLIAYHTDAGMAVARVFLPNKVLTSM